MEPNRSQDVVEVRPEVVFLYEILEELTTGRLRIPRFQRPYVWGREQMTDLLDSIYNQYPIGSLLVWETNAGIASLDRLGPFTFPHVNTDQSVGYVLDGHQRLATLAGALVSRDDPSPDPNDDDPGRWKLSWNMRDGRFQHGDASADPATLFPLPALLDTLRFFSELEKARAAMREEGSIDIDEATSGVSQLSKAFQFYRVPVIRLRQTGLSEAVEIFARLNSKGQAMSADQMVSALMYRQDEAGDEQFDLAREIDGMKSALSSRAFGEIDRTTVLRAILANLDEDIYKTDWTRLTTSRRESLLPRLRDGVARTQTSIDMALDFFEGQGVHVGRLLPYSLQLVVVSAFFDSAPEPSESQLATLRKWFWVSSFSGWFGTANPSRVNSLVAELRRKARDGEEIHLENFNLFSRSLPFPASFDMRSARSRSLLLVMLSMNPAEPDGSLIQEPWNAISIKGPDAVATIFSEPPRSVAGSPANRMIRPQGAPRGVLRSWLLRTAGENGTDLLQSHGIDEKAWNALQAGDIVGFIRARHNLLVEVEQLFQRAVGVEPAVEAAALAPLDSFGD